MNELVTLLSNLKIYNRITPHQSSSVILLPILHSQVDANRFESEFKPVLLQLYTDSTFGASSAQPKHVLQVCSAIRFGLLPEHEWEPKANLRARIYVHTQRLGLHVCMVPLR